MTALLTDNLPLLAGAPNGIKKLRELILELAVRGKLVPQEPSDEPASELLKRIALERTRFPLKAKKSGEIFTCEGAFVLPSSWCWANFGDIAQHNSGKTLDKGRNSGLPRDYITTSNLYWGKFDLSSVRQMLIQEKDLARCTAVKNDLLICEGGEAGRAAVWNKEHDICFQNHVHRARFFGEISPHFVQKYFERLNYSGEIAKYRKGVGISNMSSRSLASIPVPLPPLTEQHRIVAKIDELMALCDRLEAQQADADSAHTQLVQALLNSLTQASNADDFAQSWQRLAEHFHTLFTTESSIDALKQTLLQLAVMGKLVQQAPSDEPASELLKKIQVQKKGFTVSRKKTSKLRDIGADDELPFLHPSHWSWARLGELLISGPSNGNSPKPASIETPYRCLTLSATTRGTFNSQHFKYVDIDADTASKYFLKHGDLLIQRANSIDYVGVSAIYDGPDDQFIFPDLMMRLRISNHISQPFIHAYLSSITGRAYFRNHASGTQGNMPKINQGTVVNAPIPVPPLLEQHRIVAKVDQLMALCDQLKSRLAQARQLHEQLASTLVEQAVA